MGSETATRTDAEVAAEDAARAHGDAVESRAISVGNVVRNRRAAPDEDVPRARSRGIYRDLEGRRRVVGAGSPIPDGWERIQSATLSDRADRTETVQTPAGPVEDRRGGGGAEDRKQQGPAKTPAAPAKRPAAKPKAKAKAKSKSAAAAGAGK